MDFREVSMVRCLRHLADPQFAIGDLGGGHAHVPYEWGGRAFTRPARLDHMLWEIERGNLVYDGDGGQRTILEGAALALPGPLGGTFTIADDSDEAIIHWIRIGFVDDIPLVLTGGLLTGTAPGVSLAEVVELHRACEAMDTELAWLRFRTSLASWLGSLHSHASTPSVRSRGLSPVVRRRCLAYIHENLAPGFRLKDLAGACNLNPVYFSARFRETFGQSVRSYTKAARMSAARNLLTETDLSVTAIAEMAGFCDVYQFCRQFRQVHGEPPGRWRRGR